MWICEFCCKLDMCKRFDIGMSSSGRAILVATILGVVLAESGAVYAEGAVPSASLQLEHDTVWRGRDVSVRVVTEWVGAPDALVVLPVEFPEIEGVQWHSQQLMSEREGDTNRVVQTVLLRVVGSEKVVTIPAMAVAYIVTGDEDEKEIRTDPADLAVRAVPSVAPVAGVTLAIMTASAAVWLAIRIKRRRRGRSTDKSESGTATVLEQDLHSLRRLRLSGDYGGYFMGLLRIARELDPAAVDQSPLNEVAATVESARYGGYRPDNELAERAYRAVERLLKRVEEVHVPEGG